MASAARGGARGSSTRLLRTDGDFHDAFAALAEDGIALGDVFERERVREQRGGVEAAGADDVHQTAHAFFAARAQRCDDPVIAQPGGKRLVWNLELAGVNAKARQRASGAKAIETTLEGLL